MALRSVESDDAYHPHYLTGSTRDSGIGRFVMSLIGLVNEGTLSESHSAETCRPNGRDRRFP